MARAAISKQPSVPMPEVDPAWSVYDLFDSADGSKIFIGLTSDGQFQRFCDTFSLPELKEDPRLQTNNDRVAFRSRLIPRVRQTLEAMTKADIIAKSLEARIPFAPLVRPDELLADPHLTESGGFVHTTFPDGTSAATPKIPLRIGDHEFGRADDPPAVGQYGRRILLDIGYGQDEIDALAAGGIIVVS
jgi:crotonobetainyl-CoA:carnitine CoA-transferase CaiB-like acyl-CoA transferase